MFGKNNTSVNKDYVKEIEDIKHSHQLSLKEIESNHKLALKEKEFELRHFKDDEVKQLNTTVASQSQRIAVLEKENEMLGKITNLNADIIDIKDLVANLINKLPEIKLTSLTVGNNGTGK